MQRIITVTATLLAVASAAPCQTKSEAFNLRAKLTDSAQDLTPSVDGLYLSFDRIQQGVNIAVAKSEPTPFYLNDTEGGTTIVHDVASLYAVSLFVPGPDDFDSSYPAEHNVGILVNDAAHGLEAFPSLTGPAAGTYLICRRDITFPSGPTELPLPRFSYEGEDVPDDCAAVEFVPECATLAKLPDGAQWNHDFVITDSCVR